MRLSDLLRNSLNECVALGGQMSKISWRQVSALAPAAFFVVGSLSNIFAPGSIYQEYLRWGYPPWFHFVTGSLELTAAVLLAQARTRLWGSALGCTVMLAVLLFLAGSDCAAQARQIRRIAASIAAFCAQERYA